MIEKELWQRLQEIASIIDVAGYHCYAKEHPLNFCLETTSELIFCELIIPYTNHITTISIFHNRISNINLTDIISIK